MITWQNWEDSTWDNLRGLRVIGWFVDVGRIDGFTGETLPICCHPLAKTGKNFEVVGHFKADYDKMLVLREAGTQSAQLYQTHYSHVILDDCSGKMID